MIDLLSIAKKFSSIGINIGQDTVVEKGIDYAYFTNGYNFLDLVFDQRIKTKFFTTSCIISQEIILENNETLYSYMSSNEDPTGASSLGYNNYEIDGEILVIETTGIVDEPTFATIWNYTTLTSFDGSTTPPDLWSDGGSYQNLSGGQQKVRVVFSYFGAQDTDTPDLLNKDVFLYLSKTSDPYAIVPPEVLGNYTGPLDIANSVESEGSSSAFGKGVISKWTGGVAIGTFNKGDNPDNIFEVGNGTSDLDRKNAIEVTRKGDLILNAETYDSKGAIRKDMFDTSLNVMVENNPNLNTLELVKISGTVNNFSKSVFITDTKMYIGSTTANTVHVYNLDGTHDFDITPSDAVAGDQFGYAIEVTSTKIIISAPYKDVGAVVDAGAVYTYNLDGTGELKIDSPDPVLTGYFGSSISATETHFSIGAYNNLNSITSNATGVGYIYTIAGVFQTKIEKSYGTANDDFGICTKIKNDKVYFGSPYSNTHGEVFIYDLDGTNEQVISSKPNAIGGFGMSLDVNDTHLIVGSPLSSSYQEYSGAVYLYNLNDLVEVEILPTDTAFSYNENFGWSVSIDNNGILISAINSYVDGLKTGCAFYYDIKRITRTMISSSTPSYNDQFGYSVSMNNTHILIGAISNNGEVNLFDRNRKFDSSGIEYGGKDLKTYLDTFNHPAKRTTLDVGLIEKNLYDELIYSDDYYKENIITNAYTDFGTDIAVNDTKIAVIAPSSSRLFVYDRDGTNEISKIINNSLFSVAITDTKIIVGLAGLNQVRVYDLDLTNELIISPAVPEAGANFGWSVASNGSKIIVGSPTKDDSFNMTGAVYLFNMDGTGELKINSSDAVASDLFGYSVDINNTNIVVGAPTYDQRSGFAYIYNIDGTNEIKINRGTVTTDAQFGFKVAMNSTKVAVSAPTDDNLANASGTVFIYDLDGTNEVKISNPEPSSLGYFGKYIALSEDRIIANYFLNSATRHTVSYDLNGTNMLIVNPYNISHFSDNYGENLDVASDGSVFISYVNIKSVYVFNPPLPASVHQARAIQASNDYTDQQIVISEAKKQDSLTIVVGSLEYPTLDDALTYLDTLQFGGSFVIDLPVGVHDLNYTSNKSFRVNLSIVGRDAGTIINLIPEDIDKDEIQLNFIGDVYFKRITLTNTKQQTFASNQEPALTFWGNRTILDYSTISDTSDKIRFVQHGGSFHGFVSTLNNAALESAGALIQLAWSQIKTKDINGIAVSGYNSRISFLSSTVGGFDNSNLAGTAIELYGDSVCGVLNLTISNSTNGVEVREGSKVTNGTDITFTNVTTKYVNPVNIIDAHGGFISDSREGTFRSLTQADADIIDGSKAVTDLITVTQNVNLDVIKEIISVDTIKTVGVGKDFETLHLALRWLERIIQTGGLITLYLDNGTHILGGDGELNQDSWSYYHLKGKYVLIQSATNSKTLCNITLDGFDDGDNEPILFTFTNSYISFRYVTIDPSLDAYPYPQNVWLMETYGGNNLRIRDTTIKNSYLAVYVHDISEVYFGAVILDTLTYGLYILGGLAKFGSSTIQNCTTGIRLEYDARVLIQGVNYFTGNTANQNVVMNVINQNGGYIADGISPLKQKILVVSEASLASYTPDFNKTNKFEYTINQTTVIANPVNQEKGQEGTIVIKQDATGGRTATFDTDYVLPSGQPTLNTTPNAYNVFRYRVIDLNKILIEFDAEFV